MNKLEAMRLMKLKGMVDWRLENPSQNRLVEAEALSWAITQIESCLEDEGGRPQ